MNYPILLIMTILLVGGISSFTPAHAQSTLNVTESVPCFLNYTGSNYITGNASTTGLQMLQNCNFSGDYLDAVTLSFDWVTGGLFPFILVTVLIVATYLKYQTGIYPIAIGIVWLPFSAWAYPDEFISFGIIVAAVIGAGAVMTILIKQTKEY